MTQSAAVNAAVNAFNKELLANHIKGCVARDIREGKDEVIDELVLTLQKLMKQRRFIFNYEAIYSYGDELCCLYCTG